MTLLTIYFKTINFFKGNQVKKASDNQKNVENYI